MWVRTFEEALNHLGIEHLLLGASITLATKSKYHTCYEEPVCERKKLSDSKYCMAHCAVHMRIVKLFAALPRFNVVCACLCVVNVVNRGKGKWYTWWNLGQDKNLPPSSKSIPSTPPNSSLSWLSLLQDMINDFCVSAKKNSKSFPRCPPSRSLSWLSFYCNRWFLYFIMKINNYLYCEKTIDLQIIFHVIWYILTLSLLIFASVKLHGTSFE